MSVETEDVTITNRNSFLPIVVIVLLIFVGLVFFSKNNSDSISWKGFYYKNAEYSTSLIDQRTRLDQAPTFSTLQDCMKWGKDYLGSDSNDGFECSYGCRIEDEWGIICKDTTKMITNIKNAGTYSE